MKAAKNQPELDVADEHVRVGSPGVHRGLYGFPSLLKLHTTM